MEIEPFELNGKTIRDAHFVKKNLAVCTLRIEFTDNTVYEFKALTVEDEITGNDVPVQEVIIEKSYSG